jgi:hypothetical protein
MKTIRISAMDLRTGVNTLQNAGKAKVEGAELALTGQVGRRLSLSSGISWLPTAQYSSFLGASIKQPNPNGPGLVNVNNVDLSGTRLLRAQIHVQPRGQLQDRCRQQFGDAERQLLSLEPRLFPSRRACRQRWFTGDASNRTSF